MPDLINPYARTLTFLEQMEREVPDYIQEAMRIEIEKGRKALSQAKGEIVTKP